ncbi:accessory Sec system protein Asp2 [Lactococcus muris]|uniref:Accessory Sec system protein Asp2 n=1 Tax=Lactococcus muris TaxID=2941330 RepID=A0ABV4D7V4_9LACT|nr:MULTISPECIES: accessory Sec system protein Asp2 [Lactococcus]
MITVLQIGNNNWAEQVDALPQDMQWHFCRPNEIVSFLEALKQAERAKIMVASEERDEPKIRIRFNAILLTETIDESLLEPLDSTIEAYGLYHDKGLFIRDMSPTGIFRRKCLRELPIDGDISQKIKYLSQVLFDSQYGAKLKIPDIDVNPNFQGNIHFDGHVGMTASGYFGENFEQLFTFRYNLSTFPVALEIWQEYVKKSGTCDLQLRIFPIRAGSLYDLQAPIILTEADMQEPYVIPVENEKISFYTVSIYAKGEGEVTFGPLHWRYSRIGLGRFVLGGERHSDGKRQEVITYFNPGDMKPPLTVYFSGYRSAEGFEGYGIMKSLKTPFMLIGDPRLEGGGFYIGTPELEQTIVAAIQEALDYLGFSSSDLILSGLSMGTYGALYYAAHFNPYAVVVGKPFTNLGDTVKGMKLLRPDEFETSADVLLNATGGTSPANIDNLNKKFWEKFTTSDFSDTHFAIAYMEQDDYDRSATERLIHHLSQRNVHIYAKGYEGRHNDNSHSIKKWFMKQYVDLLGEGYERRGR